jgi:hypothetical protein
MFIHIGKSGLCCRLFILLHTMEIHKNDKIKIIWLINDATTDEIGKYITPIDNVEFLPINSDREISDIEYKYYDHRITRKHKVDNEIILNHFSKIRLCLELQTIVNDFVKTHFPYISIHVRRTDFVRYCKDLRKHGMNASLDDEPFYNFIEKNDKFKVFLTTDCVKTRALFKEKYGDKIITHHNSFSTDSLRQINMENTLLDLFIAGRGIDFKGTNHSTFSNIIYNLIILNKGEVK